MIRVGNIARLSPNDPKCLRVGDPGRNVTVVMTEDRVVRCFDSQCYHFGGDLGKKGTISIVDIEDLGRHPIIRCPDHGHEISLATGHRFERGLDGKVRADSVVQRVHQVRVDDEGDVFVTLNLQGQVASDRFATPPAAQPGQPGQVTLQSVGMRVRKATSHRKPLKNIPTQAQQTLPVMFANPPETSHGQRKLQFRAGTQMTMQQCLKQMAVNEESPQESLEMEVDE